MFRRPALCPPPAARRLGLGGMEPPPGPPPAGIPAPLPRAAVDTAPGRHQREAGTAGLEKGSAASAGASGAHRLRAQGAPVVALGRVGPQIWRNQDGALHFAHSGISLSLAQPPLSPIIQFRDRGSRDSCLPGREGRLSGAWVSALSTPSVSGERVEWREGIMRVLKASFVLSASAHYLVSRRHVGRR